MLVRVNRNTVDVKINFHLHLKESEWRLNKIYKEIVAGLWKWIKCYSKKVIHRPLLV